MSRGDVFRRTYKELSPQQVDHIAKIKDAADELLNHLYPPTSRENALAITRLEECVFWAVKGHTE